MGMLDALNLRNYQVPKNRFLTPFACCLEAAFLYGCVFVLWRHLACVYTRVQVLSILTYTYCHNLSCQSESHSCISTHMIHRLHSNTFIHSPQMPNAHQHPHLISALSPYILNGEGGRSYLCKTLSPAPHLLKGFTG